MDSKSWDEYINDMCIWAICTDIYEDEDAEIEDFQEETSISLQEGDKIEITIIREDNY